MKKQEFYFALLIQMQIGYIAKLTCQRALICLSTSLTHSAFSKSVNTQNKGAHVMVFVSSNQHADCVVWKQFQVEAK